MTKTMGLLFLCIFATLGCRDADSDGALEKRVRILELRVDELTKDISSGGAQQPAGPASVQRGLIASPASSKAGNDWEIVSVESRVTETNDQWSKFAWKLTIRNHSSAPKLFDATIEFKDREGFVVEDDTEYKLLVPANAEQTFTNYDLITAQVAGNVAQTSAKVTQR